MNCTGRRRNRKASKWFPPVTDEEEMVPVNCKSTPDTAFLSVKANIEVFVHHPCGEWIWVTQQTSTGISVSGWIPKDHVTMMYHHSQIDPDNLMPNEETTKFEAPRSLRLTMDATNGSRAMVCSPHVGPFLWGADEN